MVTHGTVPEGLIGSCVLQHHAAVCQAVLAF